MYFTWLYICLTWLSISHPVIYISPGYLPTACLAIYISPGYLSHPVFSPGYITWLSISHLVIYISPGYLAHLVTHLSHLVTPGLSLPCVVLIAGRHPHLHCNVADCELLKALLHGLPSLRYSLTHSKRT